MHKVNAGYTLLVELASPAPKVRELLKRYQEVGLPFRDTTTTHFATITVIDEHVRGKETLPASLLFATSMCGPIEHHLRELVDVMGPQLRALFGHCRSFIPGCSDADLVAFLKENRHPDTFYSGMQNLSPQDVRDHKELRDAIERYLDDAKPTGTPRAIRTQIKKYLAGTKFAWANQPAVLDPETDRVLHGKTRKLVAAIVGGALGLAGITVFHWLVPSPLSAFLCTLAWLGAGGLVAFIGTLVIGVRISEELQDYTTPRQPDDNVKVLAATQARRVINEFTIAGPIKNGPTRPLLMRIMFWFVSRAVEGLSGTGGITIPTVATARWIAANGGRRMIFISNFTNAAEPYVRDFIDVHAGAMRINVTFGFGRGYPKTRWVLWDGAVADPNAFIYVVTEHQTPTDYWYGPYEDISIDNIVRARKIRDGLAGDDMDDDAAKDWLYLL